MAVRYGRGNKYHAKKDFRNSHGETVKFDSRKEARRYDELRLMERAHQISDLQRQVKFVLIPAQRDPKGKLIERQCYYVADFTYKDSSGRLVVEDTKSEATRTPVFVVKRKLMLWVHGIRVREI